MFWAAKIQQLIWVNENFKLHFSLPFKENNTFAAAMLIDTGFSNA
jgi:hypothetical protein